MKNLKSYDDFLNEKAYLLTGIYDAKGIPGKVLFAFKKEEIERIKFEGDTDKLLKEVNAAWKKWAPTKGAKIIEAEVMKQVKNPEAIVYITANLLEEWKLDEINKLNTEIDKTGTAYIHYRGSDFVINIGFADDVDAGKYSRRLGGMRNTAVITNDVYVAGEFYDAGYNNVEIRESLFLMVDKK